MNRFFKILFIAIAFVTIGTAAKCADISCLGSTTVLVNKPHLSHACTISSMKGNNQQQTHFILLFRNGVDEKGLSFHYSPAHCELTTIIFNEEGSSLNQGLVKHVLTFFNFLALKPEFLSTSAFRSPPVAC